MILVYLFLNIFFGFDNFYIIFLLILIELHGQYKQFSVCLLLFFLLPIRLKIIQQKMAHIQYVDSLIREYMLFRGFSNSLKIFDTELKSDKDKGFRVDKIIDQVMNAINVQDLQLLRDIWNHLDGHLFSKLEHSFASGNFHYLVFDFSNCLYCKMLVYLM